MVPSTRSDAVQAILAEMEQHGKNGLPPPKHSSDFEMGNTVRPAHGIHAVLICIAAAGLPVCQPGRVDGVADVDLCAAGRAPGGVGQGTAAVRACRV